MDGINKLLSKIALYKNRIDIMEILDDDNSIIRVARLPYKDYDVKSFKHTNIKIDYWLDNAKFNKLVEVYNYNYGSIWVNND